MEKKLLLNKTIFYKPSASVVLLFLVISMISGQDPIAYYPFNGNSNDEVGSNNGTINGATLTTDRFGNANSAYLFDGVDDVITFNSPFTTATNNFTISAWVKRSSITSGGQFVSNGRNPGNDFPASAYDGYSFGTGGNSVSANFHAVIAPVGGCPLQGTDWEFVVLVREGGVAKLYRNGVQCSNTFTNTPITPSQNAFIGALNGNGTSPFEGAIDEVKIYNVALTAAQILVEYESNVPFITNSYRTTQTGNWNNITTWQRFNGTDWVAANAAPSFTDENIIIRTGHNITVNDVRTIDQTIVESGASLTITSGILTVVNGTGVDLVVLGTISLSGGSINGSGAIETEAGSTFNWSGGSLDGSGSFIVKGSSNFTTTTKSLFTKTVRLQGAVNTWTAGTLNIALNGNLTIDAGATFTYNSSTDISLTNSNGGIGNFINNGTVVKNGTSNWLISASVQFNNAGAIEINAGNMICSNSSSNHTGTFDIENGLQFQMSSGTHNFNGATSSGLGFITLLSGNLQNGTTLTNLARVLLVGGSFNTANPFEISDNFTWQGGSMEGAGLVTVSGNSSFTTTNKSLFAKTVRLQGAVNTWTAGTLNIALNGNLTIDAGATFTYNSSTDISLTNSNGGTGNFINNGTVVKNGTSNWLISSSVQFNNAGAIEINAGNMICSNSSSNHTGTFDIENGLQFQMSSGMHNFNGATSSGLGFITLLSGNLQNGTTLTNLARVLLVGGSFNTANPFEISDNFTWQGGTMEGAGLVTVSGSSNFTTTTKSLFAKTVRLQGAVNTWTAGTLNIALNGNLTIDVGATFTYNSNSGLSLTNQTAGVGNFNNNGSLIKLGNGIFTLSSTLNFLNTGTIGGNAGSMSISTTTFSNSGTIAPGTSPGILTMNGLQPLSANSTLEIEVEDGSGPGIGHDQLVRNGSLTIAGTLNVTETGIVPLGAYTIISLTSGTISGSFSTVNLPLGYVLQINANNVQIIKEISGGVINGNQSSCVSIVPDPLIGTPAFNDEATITYQWQDSIVSGLWTDIEGASDGSVFAPPLLNSPTYFRRLATLGSVTLSSNIILLDIQNAIDPNIIPVDVWHLYAYNGADLDLGTGTEYRGYYMINTLNLNTADQWSNLLSPSHSIDFNGCAVNSDFWTIAVKRLGFPPGNYVMNIVGVDNSVRVYLDGNQIFAAPGVASYPYITLGALDENSILEIRVEDTGGPGYLNFTLEETALQPGVISGNQSECVGYVPSLITSTQQAFGGSSLTLNYQWQVSIDNISFTDINLATDMTYQPPTADMSQYYRRKVINGNNEVAFSNVILKAAIIPVTPVITSGGQTTFCENTSLGLISSLSIGNQWLRNGIDISGAVSNTFSATQAGSYTVRTNSNGCITTSDPLVLEVLPIPSVSISSSALGICTDSTVILSVSGTPLVSREWFYNNISTGSNVVSYSATSIGSYSVRGTASNGCQNTSAPIILSTDAIPMIATDRPANTVCPGDPITISMTNGSTYLWNTGATTASIIQNPLVSQSYNVITTGPLGCVFYDTIPVQVVASTPPGLVTNMLPLDGSINQEQNIVFSWQPAENAISYDIYIWPADLPSRPSIPDSSDLTNINVLIRNLNFATQYNFQLVSRTACQHTDGPVQQFTTRQLPDLVVTNVQAQSVLGTPGQLVVTYTVTNQGDGITLPGIWKDRLYLSIDSAVGGDIPLQLINNVNALAPGASYNGQFQVQVTEVGEYFLYVKVDDLSNVIETNEGNNIIFKSPGRINFINIDIKPDLVGLELFTPPNAVGGQSVPITYSLLNQGDRSALGTALEVICSPPSCGDSDYYWEDLVYISNNDVFNGNARLIGRTKINPRKLRSSTNPDCNACNDYNENSISLEVDSSLIIFDNSLKIPHDFYGESYIYVFLNSGFGLFQEATRANNSLLSNPFNVILRPPADLAVTTVNVVPMSSQSGNSAKVIYSVTNIGVNAPVVSELGWTDRVYLSTEPVFNKNTSIVIGSKSTIRSSFGANQFYQDSITFQIPFLGQSPLYIFVETDATNRVFEYTFKENNHNAIGAQLIIDVDKKPDYIPSDLIAVSSVQAGTTTPVSLTINNSGDANGVGNFSISYKLRLVGSNSTPTLIGLETVNAINQNMSRIVNKNVMIPLGIAAGDYELLVFVDEYNQQAELDKSNNQLIMPISINAAMAYDLSISDVISADTVDIFQNQPSILVGAEGIFDVIFSGPNLPTGFRIETRITSNPTGLPLYERIEFINFSGGIPSSFTIPTFHINRNTVPVGDFYIVMKLVTFPSSGVDPAEINIANNTFIKPIYFRASPTPDFQFVSYPSSVILNSGSSFSLPIEIKNTGVNELQGVCVTKAILSNSPSVNIGAGFATLGSSFKVPGLTNMPTDDIILDTIVGFVPNIYAGNYFLQFYLDADKKTHEGISGELNNIVTIPVTITPPLVPDILPTLLVLPVNMEAGRNLAIEYILNNIGTGSFNGRPRNTFRLSQSGEFNPLTDGEVGRDLPLVNINPGTNAVLSSQIVASGLMPGAYQPGVFANSNFVLPESNFSNNEVYNTTTTNVFVHPLDLDELVSETNFFGEYFYRSVDIGSGFDILATFSGEGAFASNNEMPLASNAQFSALTDGNKQLIIPNSQAGQYFFGVIPNEDNSVNLRVKALPFSIISLSPDKVGQGNATTEIIGAAFNSETFFTLVDANGITVDTGTLRILRSSMQARVTFHCASLAPAFYTVRAIKPGIDTFDLVNGLQVIPSTPSTLISESDVPSRANPFSRLQVRYNFTNSGNIDIENAFGMVIAPSVGLVNNVVVSSNAVGMERFVGEAGIYDFPSLMQYGRLDLFAFIHGWMRNMAPGESFQISFEIEPTFGVGSVPIQVITKNLTNRDFYIMVTEEVEKVRAANIQAYDYIPPGDLLDSVPSYWSFKHLAFNNLYSSGFLTEDDRYYIDTMGYYPSLYQPERMYRFGIITEADYIKDLTVKMLTTGPVDPSLLSTDENVYIDCDGFALVTYTANFFRRADDVLENVAGGDINNLRRCIFDLNQNVGGGLAGDLETGYFIGPRLLANIINNIHPDRDYCFNLSPWPIPFGLQLAGDIGFSSGGGSGSGGPNGSGGPGTPGGPGCAQGYYCIPPIIRFPMPRQPPVCVTCGGTGGGGGGQSGQPPNARPPVTPDPIPICLNCEDRPRPRLPRNYDESHGCIVLTECVDFEGAFPGAICNGSSNLLNMCAGTICFGDIGVCLFGITYFEIECLGFIYSCDPNEIKGPDGYGDEKFVAQPDTLGYTIFFENDPEFAEAAASTVRIFQPLDINFQENTFKVDSFGFGNRVFAVPPDQSSFSEQIDLTQERGIRVNVLGTIDIVNKQLFWQFTTIDAATGLPSSDPDKGFLPVNDSTGIGEGFVKYTIIARNSTMSGDSLRAQAEIYFDFNEPIVTNKYVNIIDAFPPTTTVLTSSGDRDSTFFELMWTVSDDLGGSGVDSVFLWYQEDGGTLQIYGVYDPDVDSIMVSGLIEGKTYFFYFSGRDNVGNVEDINGGPDLTVSIIQNTFITASSTVTTTCPGTEFLINYSFTGPINAGNVFTVEISDFNGDFAGAPTIGSLQSSMPGTLMVVVPYLPAGSGYRVRVNSSDPITTGLASSDIIQILDSPSTGIKTWVGDENGTGNWREGNYWIPCGTPSRYHDVIIPSGKVVTIDALYQAIIRSLETNTGSELHNNGTLLIKGD